ncbi:MAG: hypothetical protein QXN46_02500 [Candidatus Woesearchaeota archaeon]
MSKIFLNIIILTILHSLIVSGEDFTATSPSTISARQCEQGNYAITITNSGDSATSYRFAFFGDAAGWLSAPEPFLLPGSTKVINVTMTIPCNAKTGSYPLLTEILTAEIKKYLEQELVIEKQSNLEIIPLKWSEESTPCSRSEFALEVKNSGTVDENYSFLVKSPKQLKVWTSTNSTSLKPGEKALVKVFAEPNSCSTYGNFSIAFFIETSKSSLIGEIELLLKINKKGLAAIEGPSLLELDQPRTVTFVLENKADEETEYLLESRTSEAIEGLSIALSPESLELKAGEKSNFTLEIEFPPDIKEGRHNLNISAIPESTKKANTKVVTLILKPKKAAKRVELAVFLAKIGRFAKNNLKYAAILVLVAAAAWTIFRIAKYLAFLRQKNLRRLSKKRLKPWIRKPGQVAFGIIISVIIILLSYATVPTTSIGIPPQTWPEDSITVINLTKYFKDPDGDQLTFSHTPLQHISIEITDGIANLIPEANWHGAEDVIFVAEDGKGGAIRSNAVRLTVLPKPELVPRPVELFFKGWFKHNFCFKMKYWSIH